ncbi:hypothetical protein CJ179_38425 [Rhodococcus sp. ACS1]|uniref:hypothetical protein n=1 Tax=Rhodococcus sp. ACS1 TaxID=2028570 RepID=UPI000BB15C8A|nr:hypothetical protein [Rhodococcus sp. ACS1]PBC38483.1 hypothetical protein CJ179_38425 [Rhodococcus sp. ACS1]
MKQLISNYIFDASAKTITLPDFDKVELARIILITDVTNGVNLFSFTDPLLGATVSGNVITLEADTTSEWFADTDKLAIRYDSQFGDTFYGKPEVVGNTRSKFRDGFSSTDVSGVPKTEIWDTVNQNSDHILNYGGNSQGSSYLRISLSPFVDDTEVTLTSKETFQMPIRVGYGLSMSQRIIGQECFIGLVESGDNGVGIDTLTPDADKAITGSTISVTSNVATITLTNHGFVGGDRISIYGSAERRMNVGPVLVTPVDKNNFTVPLTIGNGTYSCTGGMIRHADPFRYAKNGVGLVFENATTTNGTFVSRRNGEKYRQVNTTTATTTAVQASTSPYTDAFNAASTQEFYATMDEAYFRSFPSDSNSGLSGSAKWSQGIPDEDKDYKLHIRARNLSGMSRPIARITGISKSASATATVTTDVAHGLVVGDYVQIYGVADQTNFANTAAQTVIASVPNSTSFTLVIGSSATASSSGGTVIKNEGSVLAPGAVGQVVNSISRTNNVLTLVGNTTWTSVLAGEYVQVHGMTGGAATYEGAYKVLRINGTALELESTGADFGTITTGGAVLRRTDIRLHFTRVIDYTRHVVEVNGGRGGTSDGNNAVPVSMTAAATVPVSQSSASSTVTWSAAGPGGFLVNDVASAAITSTATTSATVPGLSSNMGTYAHSFNVVVTAVSGTTPTLDVGVEESIDNGTNWVRIYDFPRITATGAYTSPMIRAQYGTRYRYVQTVAGTTPSFTRAVNRCMFSSSGPLVREFFDRSISLTTLNSATPVYNMDGCTSLALMINLGAATTPPVLTLEGSEDGTNFYQLGGATLTGVASSTALMYVKDVMPKFVRARVSTVGATVTPGYVLIKGLGA